MKLFKELWVTRWRRTKFVSLSSLALPSLYGPAVVVSSNDVFLLWTSHSIWTLTSDGTKATCIFPQTQMSFSHPHFLEHKCALARLCIDSTVVALKMRSAQHPWCIAVKWYLKSFDQWKPGLRSGTVLSCHLEFTPFALCLWHMVTHRLLLIR